jgi:peptidoglycan/xylan/chitin deacetylase (PgdA/CDA1 family)
MPLSTILSIVIFSGAVTSFPQASGEVVTTTIMNDTTESHGLSLYSGRSMHVTVIGSDSVLIDKEIDSIALKLRKMGDPLGTAEIGVYDSNRNLKKRFGTVSVSSLTGTFKDYQFYLGESVSGYVIKSGDRIGIKYSGGSSQDNVSVMIDAEPGGSFDSTNTYHSYYSSTGWKNYIENDLRMKLTNTKSIASPGSVGRPVFIHFDDGTSSQWTKAKPILDEYNIKATFYIVCGKAGTSGYMSWSQIETLEGQGHSIQDHTMTHPHLPDLSNSKLEYEVSECKEIIKDRLGITPSHMAIPYNDGEDDPRVVSMISKYHKFAKGDNTAGLWELDCWTSCQTTIDGDFNPDSRYAIAQFSHDYYLDKYGEDATFDKFVSLINSGKIDSGGNVISVPIITYHKIGGSDGLPEDMFEKEMKYLGENGYRILTMDDLRYSSNDGEFYVDD